MEMEVRGMTTEANTYMKEYAERIIRSAAEMHDCTCEMKLMGAAMNGTNDDALWIGWRRFVRRICICRWFG
ncbi:MAG: hypothetical protein V8Q27_06640 [Eubacteriales bacterium]